MVIQEMELQPMMHTVPIVQRALAIKAADINERSPQNNVVRATPDNVARALESAVGLNFD